MGTNYYARMDVCDGCGRYEQRHIGKQSAGWPFVFDPGDEYEKYGELTTWCTWKAVLERPTVRIFDEYGTEQEKAEFFSWAPESARQPLPGISGPDHADYYWLERRDPEGHRFTTRPGFS